MEPNLITDILHKRTRSDSVQKLNSIPKSIENDQPSCSEITVREFLEYLKTAYQVQESLEGILMANGMTEAIDWLKLKESKFINKNESSSQTNDKENNEKILDKTGTGSKRMSASSLNNSEAKPCKALSDSILVKSSDLLTNKLTEVLSEGLLDPILPILPIMACQSQTSSRKSSITKPSGEVVAKKADNKASSVDEAPEKDEDKMTATSSQIEIHVCDEVKNTRKDFYCNQKLLVEKMGYFAQVTAGQKLEDMDISVHCDVGIFEWLMKWVQKEILLEEDWPKLDAQNVIPVVVSAAFLQMEPLLEECLRFCHENMNDILRSSTNLSCLNDQILNRLAAMYTNIELDSIRDKKDKLQSKLFTKLIQSLVEPEPECVRGHWSSLAHIYRCEKCRQLIAPAVAQRIPCTPSCMRLQFDGSISSQHIYDATWNINEHIEKLYKQLKSWRKVYWRLWGSAHFLFCSTCKRIFPANQLGWCLYHPDAPQFFTLDAQRAPLPVGRYPCCGDRAYRFQLLTNFRGCKFREHQVCTKNVRDSAVYNLLMNFRHVVTEDPPELMFPERLTRLVAKDTAATTDKLICKEVFWWDGLQIIPKRPKLGLLHSFSERTKGGNNSNSSSDEDCHDHETASSSNGSSSDDSSSEETSGCKQNSNSPRVVKKNIARKKSCRLWQVHLSARSNQDTQRSFEEETVKSMSTILNKKCLMTSFESGARSRKLNVVKNTTPLGGIWVRLENEWRENNAINTQQKQRPLFPAKGRHGTRNRFF